MYDRAPQRGVAECGCRHGPGSVSGDSRKAHGGIIAQQGDGSQCHVASTLDAPPVILLEQDCADQTGDGVLIGKDADHFGPPLDLAVDEAGAR